MLNLRDLRSGKVPKVEVKKGEAWKVAYAKAREAAPSTLVTIDSMAQATGAMAHAVSGNSGFINEIQRMVQAQEDAVRLRGALQRFAASVRQQETAMFPAFDHGFGDVANMYVGLHTSEPQFSNRSIVSGDEYTRAAETPEPLPAPQATPNSCEITNVYVGPQNYGALPSTEYSDLEERTFAALMSSLRHEPPTGVISMAERPRDNGGTQ